MRIWTSQVRRNHRLIPACSHEREYRPVSRARPQHPVEGGRNANGAQHMQEQASNGHLFADKPHDTVDGQERPQDQHIEGEETGNGQCNSIQYRPPQSVTLESHDPEPQKRRRDHGIALVKLRQEEVHSGRQSHQTGPREGGIPPSPCNHNKDVRRRNRPHRKTADPEPANKRGQPSGTEQLDPEEIVEQEPGRPETRMQIELRQKIVVAPQQIGVLLHPKCSEEIARVMRVLHDLPQPFESERVAVHAQRHEFEQEERQTHQPQTESTPPQGVVVLRQQQRENRTEQRNVNSDKREPLPVPLPEWRAVNPRRVQVNQRRRQTGRGNRRNHAALPQRVSQRCEAVAETGSTSLFVGIAGHVLPLCPARTSREATSHTESRTGMNSARERR